MRTPYRKSRVVRVSREVKVALDAERRPDERNFDAAIWRLIRRAEARDSGRA